MRNKNKHMNRPRVDKMVIVMSRHPTRKPPQEGDRRMIGGVMHVRRQVRVRHLGELCYLVNRGRPVFEWVPEDKRHVYEG